MVRGLGHGERGRGGRAQAKGKKEESNSLRTNPAHFSLNNGDSSSEEGEGSEPKSPPKKVRARSSKGGVVRGLEHGERGREGRVQTKGKKEESNSLRTNPAYFSLNNGDSSSEEGGGEGSEPKPPPKKVRARSSKGCVARGHEHGGRAQRKRKEGELKISSEDNKEEEANDKTGATAGRFKQLSPEELLVLLDNPPSSSLPGKGLSTNKTLTARAKRKAMARSNQDRRHVLQSSDAGVKIVQLCAGKPIKEYIINLGLDTSSSETSSLRFSAESGSSSESSSDSSSEEGGGREWSGAKPPPRKVLSIGGVATKSVKDDDVDISLIGTSHSKRICVRMREEIIKLQEFLSQGESKI